MFFKIFVECFSALWLPAFVLNAVYLRWVKKNPSAFIVGKGKREGPMFASRCVRFDRFWCLRQAERQDFSSLSNTKSRHVRAPTVCSLWSCISSVVKLSVYLCLRFCMRHWDTWIIVSCVKVFIVWNFFFFLNHPSCITHFLDPEFCCCCRIFSFSMCRLRF